jgi:hypothetical protein
MGWFEAIFPAKADELRRQQEQLLRQQEQLRQHQGQLQMQSALISRLYATVAHMSAENAVLTRAEGFLKMKIDDFKSAVAVMLRDSANILSNNPTLRCVLPIGIDFDVTNSNSILTLTNHAPCPTRHHLETLRLTAGKINIDNYADIVKSSDVDDAITSLEMWADNPVINQMLKGVYILRFA